MATPMTRCHWQLNGNFGNQAPLRLHNSFAYCVMNSSSLSILPFQCFLRVISEIIECRHYQPHRLATIRNLIRHRLTLTPTPPPSQALPPSLGVALIIPDPTALLAGCRKRLSPITGIPHTNPTLIHHCCTPTFSHTRDHHTRQCH